MLNVTGPSAIFGVVGQPRWPPVTRNQHRHCDSGLVGHHTYAVTLGLWVSYTPTGARHRSLGSLRPAPPEQANRSGRLGIRDVWVAPLG